MSNPKIVVSVTHLKNIIAMAEENAIKDHNLSPLIEIELVSKSFHPDADNIKIMQLSYLPNSSPVLIGY